MKVQKITKRDIEKAEEFASKRTNTALYKKRGSFKTSDIVIGALAELAVYKFLRKNGFSPSKPDFNIYDKSKKSFDADLRAGNRFFHVKGQSTESVAKYGASWLMQRHDPLLKSPKKGHYLVTCVVNLADMEVYIYSITSITAIINHNCIGECAVPRFRTTKVAIYRDYMDSCLSYNAKWGVLYRGNYKGEVHG